MKINENNLNDLLKILNRIIDIDIYLIYYDENNIFESYEINDLNEFQRNNNIKDNEIIIEFDSNDMKYYDDYEINILNKFNIDNYIIDSFENKFIFEILNIGSINLIELNNKINNYIYIKNMNNIKKFNSYYNYKEKINNRQRKKHNILSKDHINKILNNKISYKSIIKLNF